MWSNLVNQVSDIANQAVQTAQQASESIQADIQNSVNEVKTSFENDIEKSKQVNENAEKDDKEQINLDFDPLNGTCPVADQSQSTSESNPTNQTENDQNNKNTESSTTTNPHENITKQADQMADKFFSIASTWAGKALETTTAAATQVQSIATEVTKQTTENLQKIQEHELVGAITAQTIQVSKQVVDSVTDTIENKTIIGDFNKHQKEQMEINQNLNNNDNGLPWEGYEEFEILKEQILNLSTDKRTFVRNPPAGVTFNFDYHKSSKQAISILKEDKNLQKMRFELVPKQMKEDNFWRNYFYRVSLIKQSFNLKRLSSSKTSLNENSKASIDNKSVDKIENLKSDQDQNNKNKDQTKKTDHHDQGDSHDMFISTELGNTEISADDLQAEMAALGMDGDNNNEESGEVDEDWEKQLSQELAEYEMVEEGEGNGEDQAEWEKEVNDMLT